MIFSAGMQHDALEFNASLRTEIGLAAVAGRIGWPEKKDRTKQWARSPPLAADQFYSRWGFVAGPPEFVHHESSVFIPSWLPGSPRLVDQNGPYLAQGCSRRGHRPVQPGFVSLINVVALIAADHPIRAIKRMCAEVLRAMDTPFDKIYAQGGAPSIPPRRC